METGTPVFKILQWPVSELDWWATFFSIDPKKDKPKQLLRANYANHEQEKDAIRDILLKGFSNERHAKNDNLQSPNADQGRQAGR